MVKEWWIDRKKKREVSTIRRLIDFKTNFGDLQIQFFSSLLSHWLKSNLVYKMDQAVGPFIEDMYQSSLDRSSKAGSRIAGFLDFLRFICRGCYSHYKEQFTEIIKNIMQGHVAKEDVMEYSEKMKSLALECMNLTDLIIRKNLD